MQPRLRARQLDSGSDREGGRDAIASITQVSQLRWNAHLGPENARVKFGSDYQQGQGQISIYAHIQVSWNGN